MRIRAGLLEVFRVASPPTHSLGQAMVDSGYIQNPVNQTLVWPGALLEAKWVEVRCLHGVMHKYPIEPLQIN